MIYYGVNTSCLESIDVVLPCPGPNTWTWLQSLKVLVLTWVWCGPDCNTVNKRHDKAYSNPRAARPIAQILLR